jgi:hypothetical protein
MGLPVMLFAGGGNVGWVKSVLLVQAEVPVRPSTAVFAALGPPRVTATTPEITASRAARCSTAQLFPSESSPVVARFA